MAASPVLADSSYYLRLLREDRDPLKALTLAAATRDVAICGVIRCEVGRGIRHLHILQRFRKAWDVMINVQTDPRIWEEAETMLWHLDRSGTVLPLPDLVIAACAKRIGAIVLTFDEHFQKIPGIRAVRQLD
jgi:predicted nucleic acid-binding protein